MKRTWAALLVALFVWSITPRVVSASCSGFIDCLLGMTERTEVRAQRDVEQEHIKAQRDAEIAKIQAEADQRVRQADAEVERVKHMQFETTAQRDIAIAQAQSQVDQYKASIAALTAERLAGIQSNADSQIVALQAQAEIATAGILETGKTERYRIVGGWTFAIVPIGLLGLLAALYMRRLLTTTDSQSVMMVTKRRHSPLPWLDDAEQIEIREVKYVINCKS